MYVCVYVCGESFWRIMGGSWEADRCVALGASRVVILHKFKDVALQLKATDALCP